MIKRSFRYDKYSNCFNDIKNISSELIWGDLTYIKKPTFSYVIPVYKRSDLLKETIDSILQQKHCDYDWDIVIVDNEVKEKNETEQLIRDINNKRILYYRNEKNIGPDGNYNRCIELARGYWVGMVHADDLIIDEHLSMMMNYIKEKSRGKKPLAYISPRYDEFKDRNRISLNMHIGCFEKKKKLDLNTKYNGKLKRFRQLDALLTGYSVGLPSFGTVMNRKIMIKMGGFDKDLGICEDVIIPYRMAKKYKVYQTPYVMGYHRFEENESMKTKTIFEICESMEDFRQYMYSKNIFTKFWGYIAGDIHFKSLQEYGAYLSRFGNIKLNMEDFDYIHKKSTNEIESKIKEFLFRRVMAVYAYMTKELTYDQVVENLLENIYQRRRTELRRASTWLVYGAGSAGQCVAKILEKKYGCKVMCFLVTSDKGNKKKINGIPVVEIERFKSIACNYKVILATTTLEFYEEMSQKLEQFSFNTVIKLNEQNIV